MCIEYSKVGGVHCTVEWQECDKEIYVCRLDACDRECVQWVDVYKGCVG